MLIAWTTVGAREAAEGLAAGAVDGGLAACVQIEAVLSHYRWEGKTERAEEWRLTFKVLEGREAELERFVLGRHPYEIPEWIVVQADRVSEKYLSWARAVCTKSNL